MSATTDVLPGALWATRDTDTTRPTSLARALFGGFLIEAVLLGSLAAIAVTHATPAPPEIIMQVEIPKPEVPPPPPKEIVKQKPIVQKTITRKIVMQQPKPVTPQPVVEPTPAPVIAATEKPSADAPAVATPAPAAPAHAPSGPVAMTLACPVQVSPEMPAKALAMGIQGRVTARATIQSGKVISVEILKSTPPGVFDAAVKSAMMRYQCENNSNDIVAADQTFNFALN
jgi:periplasmic protein TonB